ncbi:hypothetical protein BDY24DRAFT_281547 [Mrakia frigida]|uniref:bZIP transcription factor n=1 Tax=Mrakia frigida TaxID=29902 RepID=UPI003FCC03B7
MEGDEWRPTPEEYKKLSSKEKRQLRNKISARNFRVRRKNQISTLESRLNDRERIIGAVRDELGSAKMENAELRREIQALKNAVFGATQTPTFNSNTISPAQLEAPFAIASTSSAPLPKVNRSKDVSTSSNKGFWAGQSSSPFGGGPFNTSVHAFTTPDLIFPSSASLAGKQQPNLNPLFNSGGGMGGGLFSPPNYKPSLPTATSQEGTFDEFVQATPYTLRHATVEAYRNQLWTRLAREAAFAKSSTTTNGADALASGLKPKFYNSPTSNSNSFLNGPGSKLLPGSSSSAHHSPSMSTPTPPAAASSPSSSEDTSHLAFLAHLATQSITSRLSAAFVEAFTTPGPSFTSLGSTKSSTNAPRSLDAEKIASVLSGRSVVQIVPVTPSPAPAEAPPPAVPTPSTASSASESALERALSGLSLGGSSASSGPCSVGGGLKNLLGCVGGRACHSGRPSSSE